MKKTILLFIVLGAVSLTSCKSIKPYEKEYLLSPLMDDGALSSFDSEFKVGALARYERVSSGAPSAGGATSCPTCGG